MGDSCQLKGTVLTSPTHMVFYGDKICRPINHNQGYTKNNGNPTCGHKLRDLEESLLNRPSILPFVKMYEKGIKM